MKLSVSNIAWLNIEDNIVYDLMIKYGFAGLEIAPTRLIEKKPYEHKEIARRIADSLKQKYGFVISSLQSILFGRNERLFGSDMERKDLMKYLKKAVDFADTVGCGNMVFGSPKNRIIERESDYCIAVAFFREIGEYALQHGTVVSIEANPMIYGTNFINRTDEAFKLVQDVNIEGFRINMDFGTIVENGEDIEKVSTMLDWINHIHISEPYLLRIQRRHEHRVLSKILKQRGFDKFVSIEMKRNEHNNIESLEETLRYIADVFRGK
ncbi:Xylose isomerase-like TIM barrel [Pelotomaculum sp. FP]|uniref:sugar phosphate isomerase/epimerase family protein n=1 Tax=Pelotomaculum sp. FP TaxID=261474 RepID=UPI001066E3E4|nr:sugar phosphate isomerase/epimerase family protein [Pelotomaculum sp. FP]TEB16170.1 Xylose isomerase-like TIM barrel [Pelotomaculum sp. FP]